MHHELNQIVAVKVIAEEEIGEVSVWDIPAGVPCLSGVP